MLTIGMAAYRDWEGVWSTLESLQLFHDLDGVEVFVLDGDDCTRSREVCRAKGFRYGRYDGPMGTAQIRNELIRRSSGEHVLVLDCHVMLFRGAIDCLRAWIAGNPESPDLICGPLDCWSTHEFYLEVYEKWAGRMWGAFELPWATAKIPDKPFDIWAHGFGCFATRRDDWIPFSKHLRGFGGEEGIHHEKYRQAGRRVLCLPGLKWSHRFGRTYGTMYRLSRRDKLRNHLIGLHEIGHDPAECIEHFAEVMPQDQIDAMVDDAQLTMAGEPSPREGRGDDNGLVQQAADALERLAPWEKFLLMGELFSGLRTKTK